MGVHSFPGHLIFSQQNKYHINTYMWNLGKYIDDLMYKAEIETQMERTDTWRPKGKWWG